MKKGTAPALIPAIVLIMMLLPAFGFGLTTLGTIPTQINDTVTHGTVYYGASDLDSRGEGAQPSEALSAPVGTAPSAPQNLTATPGNAQVDLNWTAPSYSGPGTITYHLFRDGTEVWSGTTMMYNDAPLTKGVQYSYTVAAQNEIGWGPNCSSVLVTPVGAPEAPWGLNAIAGDGQVALSWNTVNYTGPGILTYHLFRDGRRAWSGINLSWDDVSLKNGRTYLYSVAASNEVGWSANSSAMSATPQGPPTAAMGLYAEAGVGSVALHWSAPAYAGPGTTLYLLFRDDALIWSGTELGYMDSGLTEVIAHSYKVAVYNSIGQGPTCAAVKATPMPVEDGSATPLDLVTLASFVVIGMMPIFGLVYLRVRRKKKIITPGTPEMISMICPRCRATMPIDSTKCANCGVRFRRLKTRDPYYDDF